jgi:MFS family permease
MASPALMSLASKVAHEKEQGKVLGVLQGGASLARAIGPAIGGILLNNAFNRVDDFTVTRTFWTASAIMLAAMFIAVYFVKVSRDHAVA